MYISPLELIKIDAVKELNQKIKDLNLKNFNEKEDIYLLIKLIENAQEEHGKSYCSIQKIARVSHILAKALGFSMEYCNNLEHAAKVYDIGNIAIAKEIYIKNEKLSFEEFEIIKNHTYLGYEILKQFKTDITDIGATISLQHHEWWNGGGYPKQLNEKEIHISSRIVALADTVSALFHDRPGRSVWHFDDIVDYVKARENLQFDSIIVQAFLDNKTVIYEVLETKYTKENR